MKPARRVLLGGPALTLGVPGAAGAATQPPLPQPTSGRIERLADFASTQVAARHVDVWLPVGYSPDRRHPVLYMHDGQMLFDARSTWNRQAWLADVALARAARAGQIPETIVVGVWNNPPQRYAEYYPAKFLACAPAARRREYTEQAAHGRLQSDPYLRFLLGGRALRR